MDNSDKSLLDAHIQGDGAAFEELVRRYGGSLLGYLKKMSGNSDIADDLFQETFKRVHENAHQLSSDRFRSWLFTIATRVAIDGARRRGRMKVVSLNQGANNNGFRSGDELTEMTIEDNSFDPLESAAK